MNNNKLKKAYKFLDLAYKELKEYEKNKEEVILQEVCEKGGCRFYLWVWM